MTVLVSHTFVFYTGNCTLCGNLYDMTEQEFFKILTVYDNELTILLEGINRFQTYPDVRLGTEPEKHDILADKQLSILLTQADMTIGMKHMIEAKGLKAHFEEYYFARILSLNCYEILENHYPNIFNNLHEYKFRDDTKDIMLQIDNIRDKLKSINRINEDYLKNIRHNVIAHRHFITGLEQNKLMWGIDPERILKISIEIRNCYMSLAAQFTFLQNRLLQIP